MCHSDEAETWLPGYTIKVEAYEREVVIRANVEGLLSLANQLRALAQETSGAGAHTHLDGGVQLDDGSLALVLDRVEARQSPPLPSAMSS